MTYILLFFFLCVNPVWAQQPSTDSKDEQAKTLYNNGSRLYDEGRYKEAIQAFQEAYKLSGRHALLYNIAAAQERMGALDDSLETLYQYRIYAPEKEQDTLVKRTTNLQQRIAKQKQEKQKQEEQKPKENQAALSKQETVVPDLPKKPFPSRIALGSLYTFTGAAVLTSGYFSLRSLTARNELGEICQQSLCPNEANDLLQQDQNSAQIADVAWGLSAIGGTAIVVHLLRNKNIQISPTHIQWQGTFK